ncbi:MAG: hypothetical protein A3D74_01450 [Candidatus Levybacteria bacterium RIFCSPHIGHO2_02_FULL_37_13]|nr:MAG: hypothetical protein A3D74_01450 [Candidatus Levybacteria bacterium RIFCSPHIGHO2_02_FULL_37_13]OGH29162.1 MAG: hypothetical protein A3E40_01385 [Candidatus Levybacteria bacterium RIFCSPHIGHO2_12_FULL_37_9]OGH37476.1 MAG: hypothetical protein A3B41_04685 [Candidatus Levybacteria bacterium RIFCSPLOWO2_01_FULL_37_26]
MTQLLGFDPLSFLGITNLKAEEKNEVSQKLLDKISQYLIIRISELLSEKDVKNANSPEDIFIIAKVKIPNIDKKVRVFLEDFKKEFYKNVKI